MSHHPLTPGSVRNIVTREVDKSFNPVMQVINVKQVSGGGNNIRFRVVLSDGEHFVQGMFATQVNHLIHNNQVADNTIIRIKEYITNFVQDRNVLICMNCDVMHNPGQKIGNPTDVSLVVKAEPPPPQAVSSMYGQQGQQQQPMIRQPQQQYNNPGYGNQGYGGAGVGGGGGSNPYSNSNRFTPQTTTSSAPIIRSTPSSTPITPISQLNMYQSKWTIKARVTSKSPIKTWSNSRGEGSLFSCDILDASGVDIRTTFFKEAVDKFNPMLQMDKVYTFSGGRLKVANQQWNTCKSNFEITFDQNAEICLVEDDASIQHNMFEFKKIAELENTAPNTNVDVLCVVKNVSPVSTVLSRKTGQELFKSDLVVADDSGAEVNLTVWGEQAKMAEQNFANNPVVAFKNLRVSDFGGRSLSSNGVYVPYPKIPQTEMIKQWWSTAGSFGAGKSLSTGVGSMRQENFEDRKTIASIKEEHLGYNEKPDWVSFKATFSFIKKDKEGGPWYTACPNPNEPCKNRYKATQTADGQYHCEKCNQTYENCVRRFIFSATVADDTSNTWVSIFDDHARPLLNGVTADELNVKCFGENYDTDTFDSYFAKASFTDWVLKCKVKNEMVGDEARLKVTVVGMGELDYAKESKELLKAIEKFQ